MSDADGIRNLLGIYCELMDAAEWTAVGAMFAHARLLSEDGSVIAAGAEAVQGLYEHGTQLYDGSPRTRHVTANSVIDIARDVATARSSYVVFQAADGFTLQPIISGRYRDEFVRTHDGWRFSQRQFLVDHVGDLSHHLTYEVPSR